jgi:DNA-directed RNA polymerase subunit RPC12/RpoP
MTEFKFLCPECGQKLSGDVAYRGTQIACPTCQKTITIPAAAPAPVMPAAGTGVAPGNAAPPPPPPPPRSAPPPPPPAAPAPISKTGARPAPAVPIAATRLQETPDHFSRLAAAALICSVFVPLGSIPGIICGHLAKARIRRNIFVVGEKTANAGLLISYTVLLATLVVTGIFLGEHWHYRPVKVMRESPEAIAALQARVVDAVIIGENEDEHEVDGTMHSTSENGGKPFHSANRGGSFSYRMKVLPQRAMTLNCHYSGDDKKGHVFDIAVDDQIIATQDLKAIAPGHFVDIEYKIPASLTYGKNVVKVEFQAHAGMIAGRLYGCEILKR